MHFIKLVLAGAVVSLVGCSSIDCDTNALKTGYALPGTNTVVVGIGLDKDGIPKETFKDVVAYPGQKVLYAGPDEFSIIFKNRKTPNRKVENASVNGVVVIQIPEDILEKKEFIEEFRKNNQLVFNYGIKANGKELDPPLIVKRHD
ncbi:hypothetical protein [Cellvibrio sp. pealriver]|uniref:hypothetical protein n=1 Tax=Cellvibrio sp. pealriver TaxID=1622269 RepID=UPI000B03132B|nr:hypothetical protein [Cellvibrio sp. pealriver]